MSYISQTTLTDRFSARMLVALTDRGEVATGVIDVGVVARALADTDAVIDGYLAARYALPLAEVPALVADIAGAIAIWKLHVAAADPKIETDYKDALRMLRDIGAGAVRLSVAGAEPGVSGGTGVRITDRERPLTEANLKGFI